LSAKREKRTDGAHQSAALVSSGLLPFLAVIALLALGAVFPSSWTWGISLHSLFQPVVAAAILVVAALLTFPAVSRPMIHAAQSFGRLFSFLSNRANALIVIALFSVILLVLFYVLRSRALVYGDGYLVLGAVSPDSGVALTGQYSLQLLSLAAMRSFVWVCAELFSLAPVNALALFNSIGGVVCCWGTWNVVCNLTQVTQRRVFLAAVGMTSGTVALFFGHIENYTWSTALAIWTLWFALEHIDGRRNLIPMLTTALLSLLCHAITLPFLLAAISALSIRHSDRLRFFLGLTFRQTILGMALGSAIVVILVQVFSLFEHVGLPPPFVAAWPDHSHPYWAFSLEHLSDAANLLAFVAPLGLALLVHSAIRSSSREDAPKHKDQLLAFIVTLTCLASFWIEPLLGAARDWDLLSLPGIPLSLWGAYRFSGDSRFKLNAKFFILPAVLLVLVHNGPNIYEKCHPVAAVERLDRLLWESPQYQEDYNNAYRGVSWGTTLLSQLDRDDLAAKYFVRRLKMALASSSAWFNLGQIYYKRQQFDSSVFCFDEAIRYEPSNASILLKAAAAKEKVGDFSGAMALAARCEALDPNNATLQTTMGIICHRLNRPRDALRHFQKAYTLAPGEFDGTFNLGTAFLYERVFDSAYFYLSRARQIKPQIPRTYDPLIMTQLALGREQEAVATLQSYRRLSQQSRDMSYYREALQSLKSP
jgi:tetratricopeptide (TPR) repeat protein